MTCERIEGLLSAYLEGELAGPDRAEVAAHLAACPACAELAGLMKDALGAMSGFPEAEPSPGLLAGLYAIPERKAAKRRWVRTVQDFLTRPALQPVYAAFTVLLLVVTFVLYHPEAGGIRKQGSVQFHKGVGTVEKLYASAGGLKGEIRAVSADLVKSFNNLDLLKGGEEKK